jgi:ABC-type Na+ transport system ATPase subunit NatA
VLGDNSQSLTCLLDVISGVRQLRDGFVSVSGAAPSTANICRSVGVCSTDSFVWPELTVQEHLIALGMLSGLSGDALHTAIASLCFEVRHWVSPAASCAAAFLVPCKGNQAKSFRVLSCPIATCSV